MGLAQSKVGLRIGIWNSASASHQLLTFLLFLVAALWICLQAARSYSARPELTAWNYNEPQAEAFFAGQLHLKEIPPSFSESPNPYSYGTRGTTKHRWDASLYEGRYHSYFSPLPTLLFFMPYKLAFGTYPQGAYLVQLCLICGLLLHLVTLSQLGRRYFESHPVVWVSLALASIVSTGAYFNLRSHIIYTLPISLGFAMNALYVFLCARMFVNGLNVRTSMMAAFALAASISCRPHLTLTGLLFVVMIAFKLARGERINAKALAAFCLVLAVGATVIAGYNYARFRSITEFGLTYQLGWKDHFTFPADWRPRAMIDRISKCASYFLFAKPSLQLSPLALGPAKAPWIPTLPTGDILFGHGCTGILYYCPLVFFAVFGFLPRFYRRLTTSVTATLGASCFLVGAATFVVLSNFNFTACRYLLDFLPLLFVGSSLILLELAQTLRARHEALFAKAWVDLCWLTALLGMLAANSTEFV